jgi:serine/threonine protein kinase
MSPEGLQGLTSTLIGATLSGRYRLESKLGSGGMSTVFLARDETLERLVAVKVMHREMSDQPDQIERFRREARSVAQLSHPNVVAVIDAGEDSGYPYIVFEYCDGETLKQRIDRLGRLPFDEAAAYAIETGRGLAAAHAQHMVHRDVKPQNVLIDADGRAKVTDFGIATSLESDGLTKTGRVLGTTDYVSPEQAMGQEVDARSDIYSLGVVLYEMLTGDVPFKAETVVGVAMKHVNEPMPDLQQKRPGTSAAIASVVDTATRKDPNKRYPHMGAMLAELEGALEVEVARAGGSHGEATTVLDSVSSRSRILTSRRVSLAGILLVLGGLVAALLIVGLGGNSTDKPDRSTPSGSGPAPASSSSVVKPTAAQDFDPEGGDGEHPDDVDLAIDGNPTGTAWSTETYSTGTDLTAAGKDGVGLIVDAGDAIAAREIQITSETGGWKGEIYGATSGPPEDLEGFGQPLGDFTASTASDGVTTVTLDAATDNRYYLIWITQLAEDAEGSGGVVSISDVRLTD